MSEALKDALLELFSEAYTGPNYDYTWFIGNEPDLGLFGTFSRLTAEDASKEQPSGTTIAAHTEHLRWSLAHANAYARGEVPTGSWAESWSVRDVDARTWDELRAALRREYDTLLVAMERREDFSEPQLLTGMLALVPHAAYHLGAIWQMQA